jgi:hypothetical protein
VYYISYISILDSDYNSLYVALSCVEIATGRVKWLPIASGAGWRDVSQCLSTCKDNGASLNIPLKRAYLRFKPCLVSAHRLVLGKGRSLKFGFFVIISGVCVVLKTAGFRLAKRFCGVLIFSQIWNGSNNRTKNGHLVGVPVFVSIFWRVFFRSTQLFFWPYFPP